MLCTISMLCVCTLRFRQQLVVALSVVVQHHELRECQQQRQREQQQRQQLEWRVVRLLSRQTEYRKGNPTKWREGEYDLPNRRKPAR